MGARLAAATSAIAGLVLLVLVSTACVATTPPETPTNTSTPTPSTPGTPRSTPSPDPTPATLTLGFVGDLMFERRVEALMQSEGAAYPFEYVLPLFEGIDVLVGNLEGTFTDTGTPLNKYYLFRTDPELAPALADAGFAAVSLANNHATDYGLQGLDRTLEALDTAGVDAFGAGMTEATARAPLLVTSEQGPRIAFLGYSTVGETIFAEGDRGGVARASVDAIEDDVRAAADQAGIVVVSLHSGVEYDHQPTDTQRTLARAAIDAGASIVVGHHPHVLQPWERYGDGVIFYSLGNFVFDLDAQDIDTYGIAAFQSAVATITFEGTTLVDINFRPTTIDPYEHRPYPATEEEATAIDDILTEPDQ